jgi:hypothetical protein
LVECERSNDWGGISGAIVLGSPKNLAGVFVEANDAGSVRPTHTGDQSLPINNRCGGVAMLGRARHGSILAKKNGSKIVREIDVPEAGAVSDP